MSRKPAPSSDTPREQRNVPQDRSCGGATGAFTVDLEEWFHAHNLRIAEEDWAALSSRVTQPVEQILELLQDHGVRGTFFVLGWLARRQPALVRRIHAAGHEIASHGFAHRSIQTQARREFFEDISAAKALLEDLVGERVLGYRAPSYSITPSTSWALDEIEGAGYAYDSSIYPARLPGLRYGWRGARLVSHPLRPALWEFPLPVMKVGPLRIPVLTGAYLRLWPLSVSLLALRSHARAGRPAILNVHPWELDAAQPRRPLSLLRRIRHYARLHQTRSRLEQLLSVARFLPLCDHLHQQTVVRTAPSAELIPACLEDSVFAFNEASDSVHP